MAIAISLDDFLTSKNIHYQLLKHRTTASAYNSAISAHIPSDQVSKAIVLEDDNHDLLMAVIPAGHRLAISDVNHIKGKNYRLVMEERLNQLFLDCAPGATPAIAEAYGMEMLLDDSLLHQDKVYVEAGDHQHLLAIDHDDYALLTQGSSHGAIAGVTVGMPKRSGDMDTEWTI